MKKELLLFIILFSLLISGADSEGENYGDELLLGELGKISTKHILKYEKIAIHLSSQEDKSNFYLWDITEFHYHDGVLQTVDLVFVNKELFSNEGYSLRPKGDITRSRLFLEDNSIIGVN